MGETERSSRLEIVKACGRHLGYRAFYRCTSLLSPKETYPIAAYRALEKGVSSSEAITNPLIQSAESSDRTVDFLKWCGRVLGAYHAAVMANLQIPVSEQATAGSFPYLVRLATDLRPPRPSPSLKADSTTGDRGA
ncbi:MAG: hypothetical protein ABSG36_17705 [Acidimicrobiales bacterium]